MNTGMGLFGNNSGG